MLLCRNYWSQDYVAKKNLILSLVEVGTIKTLKLHRKRLSHRSNAKKYFFELHGQKKQVCQTFFCKTFCISASVITEAVSNRNHLGVYKANKDPRGFNAPPNKTPAEMIEDVREHIKSFPTMTSHYVRKSVKREYLDCKLSVPKMYKLYLEQCNEREKTPVSESIYRKIFSTEFNPGFFVPKKDQCLLCTKYQRLSNEDKINLEEEYKQHLA